MNCSGRRDAMPYALDLIVESGQSFRC